MPDSRTPNRVIPEVLEECERIGQRRAQDPSPKELAARSNCHVRNIQYHIRRAYLRARGVLKPKEA